MISLSHICISKWILNFPSKTHVYNEFSNFYAAPFVIQRHNCVGRPWNISSRPRSFLVIQKLQNPILCAETPAIAKDSSRTEILSAFPELTGTGSKIVVMFDSLQGQSSNKMSTSATFYESRRDSAAQGEVSVGLLTGARVKTEKGKNRMGELFDDCAAEPLSSEASLAIRIPRTSIGHPTNRATT
jgi:predicted NAD-dependent protein-ADP-ribosyltransferase YbiA (DUF1768 family)